MAPASAPPRFDGARRIDLPGARAITLRPIRPSDGPGLVAMFAGLGEDDLYRRFFAGHPPPASFVDHMTAVAERGGVGIVAEVEASDGTVRLVAEASFELLPDGNGELGITVAEGARGWLGPCLLDALVEAAAARDVPNLEAEVLVTNRRMLGLLEHRGLVVLGHDERPAVVRVAIGTGGRLPRWTGRHDRLRLLLELPGWRWHAEAAVRARGFDVLACPGPGHGAAPCPLEAGAPCPLVAGADVVLCALSGERGRALVEAQRRLHPHVPVCTEGPLGTVHVAGDPASGAGPGATDAAIADLLVRVARRARAVRPQAAVPS